MANADRNKFLKRLIALVLDVPGFERDMRQLIFPKLEFAGF